MRLGFIFGFLIFLCTDAYSATSLSEVVLSSDKSGSASVTSRLYADKSSGKIIEPGLTTEPSQPVALLKKYYHYATNGAVAEIANVFFADDGSRTRIAHKLRDNPDMFSGYSDIKNLNILSEFRWGDYYIYKVSWLSDTGEALGYWVDVVICPSGKNCGMSTILTSPSDEADVYSASMFAYNSGNFLEKRVAPDITFDVLPDFGDGYPASILIDLITNASDTDVNGKNNAQESKHNRLASYIKNINDNKLSRLFKSGDLKEFKLKLDQLNNQYWEDYDSAMTFSQLSGTAKSGSVDEVYYTALSFYQYLNSFESIQVMAEIPSKKENFVIAKGTKEGSVYPLLFVVGETGYLKQVPENLALSQVLFSKPAAAAISSWILSQ